MAGVYSQLLFAEDNDGEGGTTFPVPDGFVCVVRDVAYTALTADGSLYYLYGGEDAFYAGWQAPNDGLPHFYDWQGRQVHPPGDTIDAIIGPNSTLRVSGYLLAV